MPLFGYNLSNTRIGYLVIAALLCLQTSRAGDTYIRVNDTTGQFTLTGSWQPLSVLGPYTDNWLVGTHDPNSAEATTLKFAFDGTGFAAVGTVVNITNGQSLNLSATMDDSPLPSPVYTASSSLSDGLDPNFSLFTTGSLSPQIHTFLLTITGETSPFYLQGIAYTPTDHSQSPASSSSVGPSVASSTSTPPAKSNDAVKLGGAIGGGVGALLIVAIIIFYMMRRIRRIENKEKTLQARPFVTAQSRSARPSFAGGGYASSAPTTVVGSAIRFKKDKDTPSQTASIPSSDRGTGTREKRPLPSSSHSQSAGSQVNSPPTRKRSTTTPQRSPAPSVISVPSDYQATTVGLPVGTAVASSYVGPSPLPQEDVPPVPPIPGDVKRKSSRKTKREKEKAPLPTPASAAPTPTIPTPTPTSGLGLFSNDSVNSIGTRGSLSRPLPIVPGSRSSASRQQFPVEKVGLPPPPPSSQPPKWDPDQKRPLPPPS